MIKLRYLLSGGGSRNIAILGHAKGELSSAQGRHIAHSGPQRSRPSSELLTRNPIGSTKLANGKA